jgi:hypothetical protein
MRLSTKKLFIHKSQKLFFYVGAICNLATEFNGLVSIKSQ